MEWTDFFYYDKQSNYLDMYNQASESRLLSQTSFDLIGSGSLHPLYVTPKNSSPLAGLSSFLCRFPFHINWTADKNINTARYAPTMTVNLWNDLWNVSPQMDPVQKAVMTHTFGPPIVKAKRPIISCNICQIRFNSEVWNLKWFKQTVCV